MHIFQFIRKVSLKFLLIIFIFFFLILCGQKYALAQPSNGSNGGVAAIPDAPTGLTATAGSNAVTLNWSAPVNNGGAAITGYIVTGSPLGGGASVGCTAAAATTNCTVSGLTNGTTYSFSVAASNAVGTGSASAPASATPDLSKHNHLSLPGTAGLADVSISAPPGCTIAAPQFSTTIPGNAPAGANFPLGLLTFTAAGCTNATLSVRIDYPAGALTGLTPYKYGPQSGGVASSWFSHGTITGNSITYIVTDNGVGDSDTQVGSIADPFAPIMQPIAPTAPISIPTLSEVGMIILSFLAGVIGLTSMKRRVGRSI